MSTQPQREDRRLPKCVTPGKPDTCDILSKVLRMTGPCETGRPDPCKLKGFAFPAPLPPPPDSGPGALQTIDVANDEASGVCDDTGRTGSTNAKCADATPLTVAAGAYVLRVSLTVMPDLTDADRRRIVALGDVQGALALTVPELVTLFLVTEAQAQALRDALDAAKVNANALAAGELEAALLAVCLWYNSATSLPCAVGSVAEGPTSLPCGAFSSSVSQEEADRQAQDYLASGHLCRWDSAAIQLGCNEGYDPQRSSVVNLPAGTFSSYVSQADADEQAQAYASSQLVCVYGNPTPYRCACPDPTQTNASPTVEAQSVFSNVSAADADAQAEALANSLCDCYWCSNATSVSCGNQTVWYSPAQDTFKRANQDGSNPTGDSCATSVVIAPVDAGTVGQSFCAFRSYVSQADADLQAQNGVSAANCTYGNCGIGPRCAGPAESQECVDFSEGVGANLFFAADAVSACNMALAISKIPSRFRPSYLGAGVFAVQPRDVRCCYESHEVTVTCAAEAVRLPSTDPEVYTPDTNWCPPTPIPDNAIAKHAGTDAALGLTVASRGRFVTFPAASVTKCNTYTYATCSATVGAPSPSDFWRGAECGTGSVEGYASQAMVDALAQQAASGALTCEFESQPATVYCGFTENTETHAITGDGAATGAKVDPSSNGSSLQPLVAERGQFVSFTSLADANGLRNAYLKSLQDCFYSNARLSLSCLSSDAKTTFLETAYTTGYDGDIEAGNDQVYPGQQVHSSSARGFVERRTYRSYSSQAEANRAAQRDAASQLNCFYMNTAVSMRCAPKATVDGWKAQNFANSCGSPTPADYQPLNNLGEGFLFGTEPVDEEASGSASRPVEVQHGLFMSLTSQHDANRAAVLMAAALLDCFYSNASIQLKCDSSENYSAWAGASFSDNTPVTGTIALGSAIVEAPFPVHFSSAGSNSKPVQLAARMVRSTTRQAHANQQAVLLAMSLLDCFYESPQVQAICGKYSTAYTRGLPDPALTSSEFNGTIATLDGWTEEPSGTLVSGCTGATVKIPDGAVTLVPEYLHGGAPSVDLPPGLFRHPTSWTAAITQACATAKSLLSCSYTNGQQFCWCWWAKAMTGPVTMADNDEILSIYPGHSVFSSISALEAERIASVINGELWRAAVAASDRDCTGVYKEKAFSSVAFLDSEIGSISKASACGFEAGAQSGETGELKAGVVRLRDSAGAPRFALSAMTLKNTPTFEHAKGAKICLRQQCVSVVVRHTLSGMKVNGTALAVDINPRDGESPDVQIIGDSSDPNATKPPITETTTPCCAAHGLSGVTVVLFYKSLCFAGLMDVNHPFDWNAVVDSKGRGITGLGGGVYENSFCDADDPLCT